MKQHGVRPAYLSALCGEMFERDAPSTAEEMTRLIDRVETDARGSAEEPPPLSEEN